MVMRFYIHNCRNQLGELSVTLLQSRSSCGKSFLFFILVLDKGFLAFSL